MFGSSSTPSSRASGFREPEAVELELMADTTPPDGPCAAVVVMPSGCGACLRLRWTLPVRTLGGRSVRPCVSAGGGHRLASAPVADGVVLAAPQPPPAAEVG